MRISDWSSDVCSSDLGTDHSLPLAILAIAALFGGWIHIPLDSVLPQAAISEAAEHAEPTLALTSVLVSLFGILCAWFFFLKNRAVAAAIKHSTLGTLLFRWRSEEHTSELHSLMRISYAVSC